MSGDVIILGAGASRYLGLPLLKDFQSTAARVLGILRPSVDEAHAFATGLDWWRSYLPQANVEEMFILVDLLNQLAHYWLEGGESENWESQESFRYLIPKTILESQDLRKSPSVHKQLVKKLQSSWTKRGSTTPIITLNWDAVIEQVLPNSLAWMSKSFSGLSQYVEPRPDACGVELVKLHGSITWWFCDSCGKLSIIDDRSKLRKTLHDFARRVSPRALPTVVQCDSCHEWALQPAMLPPVSSKLTRSTPAYDFFTGLWEHALDSFWNRRRIIVIGYSFPPTDVQFRMLFLEGLAGVLGTEELVVVTEPANKDSRAFRRTFRNLCDVARFDGELKFEFTGFEKWVTGYRPTEDRPP